jgi:hypothetical protein
VDPHAEYSRALAERSAEAAREEKLSRQTGNARLLTGIAGVGVAFFVFGEVVISPWWLLIPAAVFFALVIFHARVDDRKQRAKRAAVFYEWGLARLENRWMGRGEQGERFRGSPHVYAEDLDLFGRGSLFELLCTARTHDGEDTLANWLLNPGPQDEVLARQRAIEELRARRDLREDFAILGEAVRTGVHGDSLAAWGERPPVGFAPWMRAAAAALAVAVVVTFGLYMAGASTRTPFLATLFAVLAFLLFMRGKVEQVTEGLDTPARDLDLLATLLSRMEREHFECELLAGILERIRIRKLTASAQIAKLQRLVARLDWARNMFFAPIAAVLLWREQLAMAVEAWRASTGPAIRDWIAAIGEFEALLALSGYSFEHPSDPFPEFADRDGWFEATGLGHPLMGEAQCVRNDVRLGGDLRLLVVSGSNMSGKSTLLRSVGLNTVLAWAGAPVRASSMAISPLALGASIRVVDSLQDGRSRFYAEITRLREIVGLTGGNRTVLFLIDELLSGTNSHDRLIGAEAVVRGLVNRGAIGMITTHDLALAHIGEDFDGHATNVHFEDTIEDGALHFDYRLREGVVRKSNALELMRSVGLEV